MFIECRNKKDRQTLMKIQRTDLNNSEPMLLNTTLHVHKKLRRYNHSRGNLFTM